MLAIAASAVSTTVSVSAAGISTPAPTANVMP